MKTKRIIADEVLGITDTTDIYEAGKTRHLVTSITYDKGGANYFSGNRERRGYWLSVRVEDVRDGIRTFLLFTGGRKMFIEEAKMFSAKRLASITPDPVKVEQLQSIMRAEGMKGVIPTATPAQAAS